MAEAQELRVLIHATVRKDAELAAKALRHAGFDVLVRETLGDVLQAMDEGAAALLTVEEALPPAATGPLTDYLNHQQTWSDLPLVVLTKPGGDSPWIDGAYDRLGNLTLLERPVHASTLISAVRAALRTRLRQYQIRLADQRKDEFLAMLAHELRNPLAPIGAAAQLLQLVAADRNKVEQGCCIIARQVAHMSSLIEDLLDIARVTRNLIKLVKEPADFRAILAEAVEQVGPLIRERGHHLQLDLPPDPAIVLGDHKRLVQIAVNILNNAAKYTPEGGHITARLRTTADEVVVEFADDGIGMAPELVPHVFDLFTQAERSSDRSQGGLGLGLPLVRNLARLHGGSVQADSAGPGMGSRFTLQLPVHRGQPADTAAPARASDAGPAAAQPLRVLLVDDNADAADMLGMLLASAGHDVAVEYDAAGAIERSRVFHPHVCLLDIGLPDMDGHALARRLREVPCVEQATLIAVTGYGQDQDRKKSTAAGFDHHLVKPVDAAQLLALFAQVPGG
jgi:signal transduction histidine kinase